MQLQLDMWDVSWNLYDAYLLILFHILMGVLYVWCYMFHIYVGNVLYRHVGTGHLLNETDCCVMLLTYCSCNWLTQTKAVDTEFLRTNCVVSCCQMVHKQIYCKTLISENFLDIRALQFFLLFCKKWAWRGADEVDSNLAAKLSWVVDKNTNNALVPFSNLLNLEPEPSCIEDIPICSLRVSAKRLNLSRITLYFIQSEDCI